MGQLREIYSDFIRRWRYVRDPVSRELITASPDAIFHLVLAGDGIGLGEGLGGGDCDCATVALGAMLEATGFPVRIATTANVPSAGPMFGHVFIQAQVPNVGWITLDPVLHPKKKFGAVTNHSRIAYWDLDGRLIRARGNVRGLGQDDTSMSEYLPSVEDWQPVGFAGGDYETEGLPDEWSTVGPIGFGNAAGDYGIISGAALAGIGVEVNEEAWGPGLVGARTPMLEVSPDDYVYMSFCGRPYHGMIALGDTGEQYIFDDFSGWFKKIFKKIGRGVKKVARKVKRGIKKVLKKTKFGRWLIKVGGKIKKIAMKIVRPLVKFVGKWASKLAPIAAIIPGYGTAIAAGLAAAGKVCKLMQKFGVTTKGKKGKVRGIKLKNPKNFPAFQKALKSNAAQMKAWAAKNPKKFKAMLAKQKARCQKA